MYIRYKKLKFALLELSKSETIYQNNMKIGMHSNSYNSNNIQLKESFNLKKATRWRFPITYWHVRKLMKARGTLVLVHAE